MVEAEDTAHMPAPFIPGPSEVIKNRVFSMPTSMLTRHQKVSFFAFIKIAYDKLMKDPDTITFEYDTDEFFRMIGISKKRKRSHLFTKVFIDEDGWEIKSEEYALEQTLRALVGKTINFRYKGENGKTYKIESIAILSYLSLTREKIIFRFDEWVRERVYVDGNSYVTKMPIVASFKSVHSVTLFEQIEQRRDWRRWQIGISPLKEIFGVNEAGKYKRFTNFRVRVLERAQKEIEEKTPYQLKFEYIKTGSVITRVIITWHINETSLSQFQYFMRSHFVNTPLLKTTGEDKRIHTVQISHDGKLYNANNPEHFYPTEKAMEIWKWMYKHQDALLIKDSATAAANFKEDEFEKYYGSNLMLDGEMYTNIILVSPTRSKLKIKFYGGETMVLSEEEFLRCVIEDKKLVSSLKVPASAREVLEFGKLPPIPPETTLFSKRGASLARLFGDNSRDKPASSRRIFTHGTTPAPEVDTIDSFY